MGWYIPVCSILRCSRFHVPTHYQELTLRIATFIKDIAVGKQMIALPYETVLDDTRHKAKLEDQLLTEFKQAIYIFICM